jgi:hypothetical protein
MNPKDYCTAAELAKRYKITPRRITTLCAHGRFPGAVFIGRQWWIPREARDPRRASGKPGHERRVA